MRNGVNNTKFFHCFANSRSSNNQIHSLFLDGYECSNSQTIEDSYHLTLPGFVPKESTVGRLVHGIWLGKSLSPEKAFWLERPFSLEEIKEAVCSRAPNRAPGADGFSLGFFQDCWDIVKE